MKRIALDYLAQWLVKKNRLPLVLRGARQVGKTWLVRELAKVSGKKLIELNIERQPEIVSVFEINDPKVILKRLRDDFSIDVDPANSILFLDEIQAAPELFAKLRWFAEDMPELPVVAAGSLLEFVLGIYPMSMPVGRITYLFLEPLSFEEFLLALGRTELVQIIKEFNWQTGIRETTHNRIMKFFKEYLIVGGMPKAVEAWVTTESPIEISSVQRDIVRTYRDDFPKYSKHMPAGYLDEVLNAVPQSLGKKFVYSEVNRDVRHTVIKNALELLTRALLCHKVKATASNGAPLSAELMPFYTKIVMLDVGLCSATLKLSLTNLRDIDELDLINKGGIAEQVVGQLLRTVEPFFDEPELYYWVSTDKFSSAEVDYVIQHGLDVVPIEVKAGTAGTLKSLHRFMLLKEKKLAVRINSAVPGIYEVDVKDNLGNPIQYQLRSIPFYLIGELHRLLT